MSDVQRTTARVLNERGLAWARRLRKRELPFKEGQETHPCRAVRAFLRRDEQHIPHLFLECEHGGRATRSIDFKYRSADWRV